MKRYKKKKELALIDFGATRDLTKRTILVIGVGGCGCYIASRMCSEFPEVVSYLVCESDYRSFVYSPVNDRVLMGDRKVGTQCNMELGEEIAKDASERIQRIIGEGIKMVFLIASMGGGTGSGSSPIIAEILKRMELTVIGIVITPFLYEKEAVISNEIKGLENLRHKTDALMIISNDHVWSLNAKRSEAEAMNAVDGYVIRAIMTIVELINYRPYECINIDFNDVLFVLKDGGDSVIISGKAEGKCRVNDAIKEALASPFLYNKELETAKCMLLHTSTSSEYPLAIRETKELTVFTKSLHPKINIIWGTSTDDSLGRSVLITILASGLDNETHLYPFKFGSY